MSPTAAAPPDGERGAALRGLREAHGLDDRTVVATVEHAIQAAWTQRLSPWPGAEPVLDLANGRLRVRWRALVVAGPPAGPGEIDLAAARVADPAAELGDVVTREQDAPSAVVGRAVRVAKAALAARVRAADRSRMRAEALALRGQLVDGIVERSEGGAIRLRVGSLEVALAPGDQLPGERMVRGQHRKLVLLEVPEGAGDLAPRVSRADPLLLRRLLETEVPEVAEGLVTVEAIAREAGRRSKVAVGSTRAGVDPVGACVGPRGVRIAQVTREVAPERVDIVAWHPDPARFVAAALAPAAVRSVELEPATRRATVAVAPDQLSLAIGRAGQNARLAARLTGWRIDIRAQG